MDLFKLSGTPVTPTWMTSTATGCNAEVRSVAMSMTIDVEQVDLAVLAAALSRTFQDTALAGYIRGRTALRDAVTVHLACWDAEAERLVAAMIGRGFLRFTGDPTEAAADDSRWIIGAQA